MKWLEPSASSGKQTSMVAKDRPAQKSQAAPIPVSQNTGNEKNERALETVAVVEAEGKVDDKTRASLFEKIFNVLFPKFG